MWLGLVLIIAQKVTECYRTLEGVTFKRLCLRNILTTREATESYRTSEGVIFSKDFEKAQVQIIVFLSHFVLIRSSERKVLILSGYLEWVIVFTMSTFLS